MQFCKENWEDIRKYYEKSYMKFPCLGDEAVYVDKVSAAGLSGKRRGTEFDGWEFTFDKGPREVDFILPRKSFFEHNGCAHFLARIPARQYKRGITHENTSVWFLGGAGFSRIDLDLDVVNSYTQKPAFMGFRDTLGTSYPVSSRMAVDPSGRIFVDKTRIGWIEPKEKQIMINRSLFIPEVEKVVEGYNQGMYKILSVKKTARPPEKEEAVYQQLDLTPAPAFFEEEL